MRKLRRQIINPSVAVLLARCSRVESSSAPLHEAVEEEGEQQIDVEEIHRIFKLGDIDAAVFIDGLNATAYDGRVSWIPFLRFMFSLANAKPLTTESRAAVTMAKRLFTMHDKEHRGEVDLRALASGLVVRKTWVVSSDCLCHVSPQLLEMCLSYPFIGKK